jgi:transcriptional regulator with XRE-family HTH domain
VVFSSTEFTAKVVRPEQAPQHGLRLVIKELAEEQGFNRNQLQLRSGVTLPLLTRYWNKETGAVTLNALERIAQALRVKATDLIEEVSNTEQAAAEGQR